jgi:thiol-disulfide isomerase/thioredoxin
MHAYRVFLPALLTFAAAPALALDVGDTAPPIEATKWYNNQGPVSMAHLRGRIVVIDFWATWCMPCKAVQPVLVEMHNELNSKGVVFVGLSDEPAAKVGPFIEKDKTPYVIGAGSKAREAYGIRSYPTAIVIDPLGKVVFRGHPSDEKLQETILETLRKTPPKSAAEILKDHEDDAARELKKAVALVNDRKYAQAATAFRKIADDYGHTTSGRKARTELPRVQALAEAAPRPGDGGAERQGRG